MPLGIIQPSRTEKVPGTVLLFDENVEVTEVVRALKHGSGKDSHTVLVPQPSDDPNDPLNWPLWQKDLIFFVVFINTIVLSFVPAPLLAPSIFVVAESLHVSLDQAALLSGYHILVAGIYGPFCCALASKYGKRPQFLFAGIMGIIGNAICIASTDNYNRLLAGRIIQGIGVTAFEALSLALIGDLYFMHQRALRTGGLVLVLTSITGLVSIIAGPISNDLGWRYNIIISLPFTVVVFLGTLFLVPETQYRRAAPDIASLSLDADEDVTTTPPKTENDTESAVDHTENAKLESKRTTADVNPLARPIPAKKTYIQSLAIYTGTYSDSFVPLLTTPFVTIINPAVIWTLLLTGVLMCLYVSISFFISQVWAQPPYNLNPASIGYWYVGGVIGGVLGGTLGAWICDYSTAFMTKRNKGTFEPEFRIVSQIVAVVFILLGYFLFMWRTNRPIPTGYLLGSFCMGSAAFGTTLSNTSATLYILDAYRQQSMDIFILQMVAKNLIAFGFSYFVNSWVTERGAGNVFMVFGIISACIFVTNVPMYVLGKLNRKMIHNQKFVAKLGVEHM